MKHKKIARLVSALVFFVVLASVTSVFVFSADFDFSYKSAPLKKNVYAGELLEENLGLTLTNAEKQYLKAYGNFVVSFNSHIPTTSVQVSYDEGESLLTVKALEYSYTASNDAAVIWKPISVSLAGEVLPLSAPDYTASFTDVSSSDGESVDVIFKTEFIIPEAKINELLNAAYINAPIYKSEIDTETEKYQNKLSEYSAKAEKYEAYLIAMNAYTEYLSDKRIYDEMYEEYTQYLAELEAYKKAKAEYDAYDAAREKYLGDYAVYLDYLAYVSVNQSQIDAYERYENDIKIAREQLQIIHGTKRRATSLSRSVYSAVMGDTVTSVIENKDAIANNLTGADPKAVDLAGAATENLRALYNGFFSITDENEQYNYYVINYTAFKDNFSNLFRALDKLYMNPKVRGVLKAQEKQEKYLILLAELYYVTNAISDEPVKNYDGTAYFDDEYIIGKGYNDQSKPITLMEGEEYMTEPTFAAPLSGGYPQQVPKPEYTEEIKEPTMPVPVPSPIEPEPVSKPEEPTEVSRPEPAEAPGVAPTPYVPDPVLVALVEAYDAGLITERPRHDGASSLSPEIKVTKKFKGIQSVTAVFYDTEYTDIENAQIISQITVDKGTCADYREEAPRKNEDSRYFYTHIGWSDSRGNEVDLSAINSDIELYPVFSKNEKPYTSVWIVDGTEYTTEPDAPQKAPEGDFCYEFIGWSESWEPTAAKLTLTASFEENYILKLPYAGAKIEYTDSKITASVGSYLGPYDLTNLLNIAAGGRSVTIQSAMGTLEFSYAETVAMKKAGIALLDFSTVQHIDGEYGYYFKLYDSSGAEMSRQTKAVLTAQCINSDPARTELFYLEDGAPKLIKGTFDGKNVSFTAVSGREYQTRLEYRLGLITPDGVDVSIDRAAAKAGSSVSVTVLAPPGIRVERVYFINSRGEKTDISDSSFIMPAEDVTVGVDYTVEEYRISFVSEGNTIAVFNCRYGDTVTPPKDPYKASTDNFAYTFIGWSEDVVPATRDAVYTAVYARSVISDAGGDAGLQISPSVMRLLLLAGSAGIALIFIFIPSSIMAIFVFKKRKSKLKIKS